MRLSLGDPISTVVGLIKDGLDRFGPADKTKVMEAQAALDELRTNIAGKEAEQELQENLAAAGIIKAEASSSHWLEADWRPIFMLVLLSLVVARFFGFTAPNVTPAEYMEVWDVVKIGVGGYVFMHPATVNAVGSAVRSLRGR